MLPDQIVNVGNEIQQVCHTLLGRDAEQQQVLVQQRVTA
jgi:hypothetical protein